MSGGFTKWIGREERSEDLIHPRKVAEMAATLDMDASAVGQSLPPGQRRCAQLSGATPAKGVRP